MKKIGHGKIPLTNYHVGIPPSDGHPVFIEVDVYLGEGNEIKLVYRKAESEPNYLVVEPEVQKFLVKISGVKFLCHGDPKNKPETWQVFCEHTDYKDVCAECVDDLYEIPVTDVEIYEDGSWVRWVDQ